MMVVIHFPHNSHLNCFTYLYIVILSNPIQVSLYMYENSSRTVLLKLSVIKDPFFLFLFCFGPILL